MQLLEWLFIILTYFAAYGVWSAFERYRENAAYRSKKTRRLVRFGVLTLVLIGVGVAYNLPATQRLFPRFQVFAEETPQEAPQQSGPALLSERSGDYPGEYLPEYLPGRARLVVTPPLLGAAPSEAERGASREVSVAALPEITPEVPEQPTNAPTKPIEESDAPRTPVKVSADTPAPPKKSRAQTSSAQTLSRSKPTTSTTRSPERSVRISFQSDPSGATLYIDGERVGVTPVEVAVEAGKRLHYTLKAEANLPNHELYYPHLDMLSADQDAALSVWLERLNSEEVAALQARGDARDLPDFNSFD